MRIAFLSVLFLCFKADLKAQTALFDVIDYAATIEPTITSQSLRGKVTVLFKAESANLNIITLNAGKLDIDTITQGTSYLKFEKKGNQLIIYLAQALQLRQQDSINIIYHGSPKFGIVFSPKQMQVYTLFSTSQWMPCVEAPDDKATFHLKLIVPNNFKTVANGLCIRQQKTAGGKLISEWVQNISVSTYLFGFVTGKFKEVIQVRKDIRLRYLTTARFSTNSIQKIFSRTADMLHFYELKSGIKYPDKTYTQVLVSGSAEQEMSSFTVMNEDYGMQVLDDTTDIWLAAHECAHQWWGNGVTNQNWLHFWLNEGMANFITAAYLEHCFGKLYYDAQIAAYRQVYEELRSRGKDKSLVFQDWDHPSSDDRKLVYNKGGYVLHLLRAELGEDLFWKGIKAYTQNFWGKSVTTLNFQHSMEAATGKDLSAFFDKWVYVKSR